MKMALHEGGSETLNVYIRELHPGLLGWATLITSYPDAVSESKLDGVVITNEIVPPNGAYIPLGYDQAETLTHEVGHWLNLYHVFQGGCDNGGKWGDFVDDTRKFWGNNHIMYTRLVLIAMQCN